MSDLPKGWVEATLEEIVDVLDARRVPVNAEDRAKRRGTVPYYGATGQVGWIDAHLFDEELILLGEDGAPFLDPSRAKAYVVRGRSWVNNHAHVLRPSHDVVTAFVLHQLNAYEYRSVVSGTTRLKLPQAPMRSMRMLVAPAAEQARLGAALDEQLSRIDAGVAALERAQANLRRYRASVLKAAVGGLLGGVRGERPIWRLAELRSLALPTRDAVVDGPFGSKLKTEHYTAAGPRVLRLQNIGEHEFVDARAHISEERYATLTRHRVDAGDLLVAGLGEELPRACVAPAGLGAAIVKADVFRLRLDTAQYDPRFVSIALNAEPTRRQVANVVHGVGRPRLNLGEVSAIKIPVPSLAQQRVIADAVDAAFESVRALEVHLDRQLARAHRLRQSLLKHAFEGKLVPQDPNDEPASELLARIRAERAAAPAPATKKRTARPTKAPGKRGATASDWAEED